MYTAAVALSMGHWPFGTALMDMDDDDWLLAVSVIDEADRLRTEG